MLTLLLEAEDDPSVEYAPDQIRDEVATFLIAGHETTALSLTYTLSLLSAHSKFREQIREEARTVLGNSPTTPRYEHVSELTDTRRVYDESLRLYPPAWAVFREANAETRLGEYRVGKGSAIIMPQWSIHRDRRYFERPETSILIAGRSKTRTRLKRTSRSPVVPMRALAASLLSRELRLRSHACCTSSKSTSSTAPSKRFSRQPLSVLQREFKQPFGP